MNDDPSWKIANQTFEKGKAAVEQSAKAVEQSYSATVENIRDFNVKMIEMAHVNTEAVFEFARQLATAKTPSDIMELWTSHARKQFESLSEQTKELTAFGQKIAGESAGTITRGVDQTFKKSLLTRVAPNRRNGDGGDQSPAAAQQSPAATSSLPESVT